MYIESIFTCVLHCILITEEGRKDTAPSQQPRGPVATVSITTGQVDKNPSTTQQNPTQQQPQVAGSPVTASPQQPGAYGAATGAAAGSLGQPQIKGKPPKSESGCFNYMWHLK